jgi:hypothetical protein
LLVVNKQRSLETKHLTSQAITRLHVKIVAGLSAQRKPWQIFRSLERLTDGADQEQVNAMAAKGYHEAFQAVTASLREILGGRPAPAVVNRGLPNWYRALFSPSVQSGLLPAHALAGYRNRPVFIRGSEHVPPPHEALPELLDTLFELLTAEPSAGVQAVLGHFLFVYIHLYSDGNGRIGRFILNTMLASGGYPWAVIRVEQRRAYMRALENAAMRHDIGDFTRFVAAEMIAAAELKGPMG